MNTQRASLATPAAAEVASIACATFILCSLLFNAFFLCVVRIRARTG